MVDSISTLGLQLTNASNLTSGQTLLAKLSQQLTTGTYSSNLTDYSSSSAQKLMNFNSQISQQQGFLDIITTLTPRLEVYDQALTGIEDTAGDAFTALASASTYNSSTNDALQSQIEGFMRQVSYYLNQRVGDRYVFSGTRYEEAPVTDLTALPVPPTETAPYLATGDAVPSYDRDYDAALPLAEVPEANVKDSVSIDTTQKLTYGVTSNEDGFQQIIMGLRFAYAATQDPTNYESYMETAQSLISTGLTSTRATHTDVTNAYTTLNKTKEMLSSSIGNLTSQIDDIQKVDINEVAVKITTLQAQLEASYSATAIMANLSIIDYL